MSGIARYAALIGVIAGALLVPVGLVTAVFAGPYLANLVGLDGPAIALLFIAVLAIAHALPVMLLAKALWGRAEPWRCWIMLALAPVVVWPGAEGLLVRGDWGDFVLLGPYLVTGLCLLPCGVFGLLSRKR